MGTQNQQHLLQLHLQHLLQHHSPDQNLFRSRNIILSRNFFRSGNNKISNYNIQVASTSTTSPQARISSVVEITKLVALATTSKQHLLLTPPLSRNFICSGKNKVSSVYYKIKVAFAITTLAMPITTSKQFLLQQLTQAGMSSAIGTVHQQDLPKHHQQHLS